MIFKYKWVLLILILLPLLVWRTWRQMRAGHYGPQLRLPAINLWGYRTLIHSISPRFWPIILYAVSAAFFIIALARPQSSSHRIKRNVEGIDIIVVLDLSASMRVEDFRDKNRIDVAKPIIKEFIQSRLNDRIGLETFSGEAVTLVPPTLDHTVVVQALDGAGIGDLKDGTAIGDALSTAVGRLRQSVAKSRVVVLLTDGDSNIGQVDPLTAGELAKSYGIKVYSIAIGRDGRVPMPFVHRDVFGRLTKSYQYYENSINPDLLQKISVMTSGKFYRVYDDPKVLRHVFQDIDQLEKTKVEATEQVRYEERFLPWMLFGLLSFVVGLLLQFWWMRVFP